MVKLDDDSKDVLAEILDGPGWAIFMQKVFTQFLKAQALEVFRISRGAGNSQYHVGAYDGAVSLMTSLYESSGIDVPHYLKELKKGMI